MFKDATTVLTVRDVRASLAYYRDSLGFDIAFEYGDPVFYAGLCRDKATIHLISAERTPRQPGHGAVALFVDDVNALYADFVRRGAKAPEPPADRAYGLRDFNAFDLDGNQLIFGAESEAKAT